MVAALLMTESHFTAPLQGAGLILALYPGRRYACPGLFSSGPSGSLFGANGHFIDGAPVFELIHGSQRDVGCFSMGEEVDADAD